MGGVRAYSTLGWFDDPLLSTFIRVPDTELARLVFHELATKPLTCARRYHFQRAFAVAVEEEGVRRWLEHERRGAELDAFRAGQTRKREFAERPARRGSAWR